MSNKQQTAVEFIEETLKGYGLSFPIMINQAKAKQVKENADYFNRGFKQGLKTAIQRIENEQ